MFEVDIRSRVGQQTLDPQIGDVVQIAGPNAHVDTSIDTMARKAGTIQHEVTIGLAHRHAALLRVSAQEAAEGQRACFVLRLCPASSSFLFQGANYE